MPEIRIKVSEKLDGIIEKLSDGYGIAKTEYVKNLIIKDLKEIGIKL